MTPEQVVTLKSDFTSGPLSAQVKPLLALGPVVDTLYDFPAGTQFQWPAGLNPGDPAAVGLLQFVNHNVVTYTINGIDRMFVGLTPVPADVFSTMSTTDQATLLVTHIQHSQDQAIADLYNAVGSETITLQYADKNDVLSVVEKAVLSLAALDPAVQGNPEKIQKWQTLGPMLIQLLAASGGQGIEQVKASGLTAAVADGLISAQDAGAPWVRACSHSETLFGVNFQLSASDVGHARNS